jgi:hypothetical protein
MPERYPLAIRCWLTSSPSFSTDRYLRQRVATDMRRTGARLKFALRASVARAVPNLYSDIAEGRI